ncbi:MAG: N-acetylmuramoyl-L-alanine amidase, partial [Acidobacteria bacterium]|nr:N-acetylmuramoyl-L-alanine amidase [Acidobacteriota bacterium]
MGLDRPACTAGAAAPAAGLALPAQAAAPKPPVQFVSAHPGNFTRRASRRIDRVIIHTVEGSYQGCIAWFRNPAARASAHYVVSFGGAITQMVADHDIAWHAGNWSYNERAVGIEHEGYAGRNLWTMDQYRASAALTRFLCEHYGIPKDRGHIIAHKDVPYPNTHWDPGPHFDWGLYLRLVNGGPPPTNPGPDYDGRWKAQHHDASLVEGESKVAWVEYENTGTRTWTPGRTRLGTTEPRDRPSAFHTRGNWVSPDRPTGVDHATAPGQTGRF